jgi:hypothetical protein
VARTRWSGHHLIARRTPVARPVPIALSALIARHVPVASRAGPDVVSMSPGPPKWFARAVAQDRFAGIIRVTDRSRMTYVEIPP